MFVSLLAFDRVHDIGVVGFERFDLGTKLCLDSSKVLLVSLPADGEPSYYLSVAHSLPAELRFGLHPYGEDKVVKHVSVAAVDASGRDELFDPLLQNGQA